MTFVYVFKNNNAAVYMLDNFKVKNICALCSQEQGMEHSLSHRRNRHDNIVISMNICLYCGLAPYDRPGQAKV